MTEKEMIALLATHAGTTKDKASAAFHELFATLADQVAHGNRVRLPYLGSLETYPTSPRIGRNPKTGDAVEIPAGHRLKVHMTQALKRRIAAIPVRQAAE